MGAKGRAVAVDGAGGSLEEHEDLPSGDSLAAELTRFLRERDAADGDDATRGQ